MSEQTNHNEILNRLSAIEANQTKMADILLPMNESYQAAIRIGKWASAALVFIAVAVGIIVSFRDLIVKK